MKRKSILFGSIFVLALMFLMPSIPAIQQKTIEDKAYSDFVEELKELELEEIKTFNDDIKLPILYAIVIALLNFRKNQLLRVGIIYLMFFSGNNLLNARKNLDFHNQVLFVSSLRIQTGDIFLRVPEIACVIFLYTPITLLPAVYIPFITEPNVPCNPPAHAPKPCHR